MSNAVIGIGVWLFLMMFVFYVLMICYRYRVSRKWTKMSVCLICNKILTNNDIYFNNGVCPCCGTRTGRAIVRTEFRSAKLKSPVFGFRWEWEIKSNKEDYL